MAMEQGLYAQVVLILWRDSEDKKEKENKNKYNFKGQSARSIRWFDLDHEWLKTNFSTSETDVYRKLYKTRFSGDDQASFYMDFSINSINSLFMYYRYS